MKWTQVCPLFGVALFACATGENSIADPPGFGTGGATAGSSSQTGGSGGSISGGSISGGSSASGAAGSSSGGTFGFSGASSFAGTATAGTFGMGGTFGSGGTGEAGGAGGSGGKASAGAAGTGGKASGGSGGGGSAQCAGTTIPAKSTWEASALRSSNADLPAAVHDGSNATRYASGSAQAGDEWLEIDFGGAVTLNEITMHTSNNDYFRHYQLRLSNESLDFDAPILKEADGVTGTIVGTLAQARSGRYLTIRQTGTVAPTWWSLYEVSVACK